MRFRDYSIRPENLPRIRELGYVRFVLFYGVIPTALFLTAWIPAHKWLTTRGTIYSDVFDILDVLELARNVALLAPLAGIVLGTLMWCAIVGANLNKDRGAPPRKPRPMWQAAALVLAGCIVGVSIGIRTGIWIHRDKMSPWEDSQIAYAAAWYHYISARDLYLNGDYPAAREALLEHVKVLSKISDERLAYTGFLEPRLEIAHTYSRLSLLEQSNGNLAEAQQYWDQAASLLRSAGWKEVNRRKILITLKAVDGALPNGIVIPEPSEDQ